MLVPISASYYLNIVCMPAAALGCAPGSPVADFAGCSACPAKQCLERLSLADPKLKAVKSLGKWINWLEDTYFETAPVTCSAACGGCATLGSWSGERGRRWLSECCRRSCCVWRRASYCCPSPQASCLS